MRVEWTLHCPEVLEELKNCMRCGGLVKIKMWLRQVERVAVVEVTKFMGATNTYRDEVETMPVDPQDAPSIFFNKSSYILLVAVSLKVYCRYRWARLYRKLIRVRSRRI